MPPLGEDEAAPPRQSVDVTQEIPLTDENDPPVVEDRRRKRKYLLIGGAVVVVAGAALGLSLGLTGGSPATGLVVTSEVVKATTGTIKQTVATSGTLQPASQANLDFGVSGVVTAVDVKAGQVVTAGQVLATVGTTALQAEVDSAQAQLQSAQARLSSDEAADAETTQIDSDEAAVTSAESSLSSSQTSLADASLTSTIAGTVASVDLAVGQQVTGSGSGGSGSGGSSSSGAGNSAGAASAASDSGTASTSSTGQVVVISTDSFIVNTTVDDTEIGQIQQGDQATITPTGATTLDFGTVASIGLIASESSDVATFPVVIDVTGDPTGLFAGSTADVSIIVKQLNNVVEVPTAAITYSTSGQATVTEVKNGKHVSQPVTVGQAAAGETQITSGISSGDSVVERVVKFTGVPGGTRSGGLGGAGFTRGSGFGGSGFTGGAGGGFGGGGFTRGGGFGGAAG
jgi:membrane fusion protein, macrolide-specific efflux system